MTRPAQTTQAKPPHIDWRALRPEVTDELLAAMAHRIVEAFHPEKVILFGSYAWGTPHEESDVDLMVVMESDLSHSQRYLAVDPVARVRFLSTDLLVRTPEEIRERLAIGDHFIRQIIEEGKVLYARDSH